MKVGHMSSTTSLWVAVSDYRVYPILVDVLRPTIQEACPSARRHLLQKTTHHQLLYPLTPVPHLFAGGCV